MRRAVEHAAIRSPQTRAIMPDPNRSHNSGCLSNVLIFMSS